MVGLRRVQVFEGRILIRWEKNVVAGGGEKKPTMAMKATVALVDGTATSKTWTSDVVHLYYILANVSALVLHGLKMITEPRPWRLHIQMLIERVVMDTRFFAMLAMGGSLLGSVLCFLEADENLCVELAADVEDECTKQGPVESVKVCDNHPQGVVLMRFKDMKDARKCIEVMNGRWISCVFVILVIFGFF